MNNKVLIVVQVSPKMLRIVDKISDSRAKFIRRAVQEKLERMGFEDLSSLPVNG